MINLLIFLSLEDWEIWLIFLLHPFVLMSTTAQLPRKQTQKYLFIPFYSNHLMQLKQFKSVQSSQSGVQQ